MANGTRGDVDMARGDWHGKEGVGRHPLAIGQALSDGGDTIRAPL